MALLEFCQWLQDTPASTALRESTWGFPILGATHVLILAWFGGAVLIMDLRLLGATLLQPDVERHVCTWRRTGIVALLSTGALLFGVEPLKCYYSVGFRAKAALLLLLAFNAWANSSRPKLAAGMSLALWIAIIFAARATAFF